MGQTPSFGSVDSSHPTLTWCGGTVSPPGCSAGPQTSVTGNLAAATCGNSRCESFSLTVGPANSGDVVSISISWSDPLNDFDLHVFNAAGEEIATSATGAPGSSEHVTIPAVAGMYAVKALFYTVAADNYTGTAQLQAGPPPRTASYVTGGITFSPNVTVKAPVASADGEPSNRTDFQGNAYVSGIRGVPAGEDLWFFDMKASSAPYDGELCRPHAQG